MKIKLIIILNRKTGILMFGEADNCKLRAYIDSMKGCGIPYETFSGKEATRRYPHQLKLPDNYSCVFDQDGGLLRANRALAALQVCLCSRTLVYVFDNLLFTFFPPFCSPPPPPPLQELFVSHGGQLLDNHKVIRIIPGPVVTVETEKASFRAKRVILTAGAWTNQLLQHTGLSLPLKVSIVSLFNFFFLIFKSNSENNHTDVLAMKMNAQSKNNNN